ncbi:MAG TPA: M3 family oligoendopeptidase [Anaerolineales bacterium]|nr:M3 family oligoendopeptidase [Anaerolineales bacterium]
MTDITTATHELGRWSLDDLFPGSDTPEFKAGIEQLETALTAFESRRGELGPDVSQDALMSFVHDVEVIMNRIFRLYAFAVLRFTEDTQNQQAAATQQRVMQLYAQVQNKTLYFTLWWKALDDETAARLMAGAGEYAYFLQEMRNLKPYTLSEPEEKVINIKNVTGRNALDVLYDTITSRYTYDLEIDGEVQTGLTRDALMQYTSSPDADLRARAYQTLYARYGDEAPILGQIYQNIVTDWKNENVDLRRFASPISVRNLSNDIPDVVVNTLLEVTEKNAGVFQRYFKLKAKWLGMEKLRRYDVYAPVAKSDRKFTYGEAVDLTLTAFSKFEPRLAEMVAEIIAADHVDSELRTGKSGGAFCWGVVPELTPWVQLNFAGRARDVSTLAHEMGHAVHAMLASHLPMLVSQTSLPLAETASTFGEMLLIDHLLANETDEGVRRDVLFRQMDDAWAVIIRQIFFALFERKAHEMIKDGADVDQLAEAYMENLRTQFGDGVEIGEEFKWEWISIPHIYGTPFYVYAYAFGQLLVIALYRQYQAEGESFKPRYLEILSAGGSLPPNEILTRAGIDVTKAEFWQGGFDLLEEMLAKLEEIPIG